MALERCARSPRPRSSATGCAPPPSSTASGRCRSASRRCRRRVGAAPRRGVRGRAGDHRRGQGARADLEAEEGEWVPGTRRRLAEGAARRSTGSARGRLGQRRPRGRSRSAAPSCSPAPTDDADLVARARARLRAVAAARAQRDRRRSSTRTSAARRCAAAAREAVARAAEGYSNLELDLGDGRRGSRHDHVEALLRELTGAEAAMAVNNCAAAVLLAVAALGPPRSSSRAASSSRSAAASASPRSSRRPARALVEVGTTNRTRLARLRARADDPDDGRSCARTRRTSASSASSRRCAIEELCGLGAAGRSTTSARATSPSSSCSPTSRRCAGRSRAGAALVCFSGDKLLGGPQAGLMVGTREAVDACRAPPARAGGADRQALARRAGGDARAVPRPRARARARSPSCAMLLEDPRPTRRARWPSALGGEVVERDGEGRRRRAAAARAAGAGRRARRPTPTRSRRAARGRPAGRRPHRRTAALLLDPRTLTDDEVELVARGAATPPLTLGTAGHIDHGKTALVRALTGVDTDRLPRSASAASRSSSATRRSTLPCGRRLSVVDVPGPRALRAHDGRRRDRASTCS